MLKTILTRYRQGFRTIPYPDGPPPALPPRMKGRPSLHPERCTPDCRECTRACPTEALRCDSDGLSLDLGRCIFCGHCIEACPQQAIEFAPEAPLAVGDRQGMIVTDDAWKPDLTRSEERIRMFGRSFKLRQVSAGGCNACEADSNVLTTVGWDLERFGIQFVASPRHADALLVTGPVTANMRLALLKTYEALPAPKLVIATGACAVSGGIYRKHPETCSGVDSILPVDLYIPGCPPHPLTILDGLLRLIGRI